MAMNLNLYLLLFLVHLGIVVSYPIQKVITNHCNGLDCEIKIQYHDAMRDISLHTISNDSIETAQVDIAIPRDKDSEKNDLVNLIGNLVRMLSSMIEDQQGNHQQLDDMIQQLDLESQPNPTQDLVKYLETSSEIVTTRQTLIETTQAPMQDCSTAPSTGQYSISGPNYGLLNPFLVVCDMDTASGGWIVIQRRFDGSVSFDRNWADYENGFGTLDGEFWLGLSKMHAITRHGTCKLRFDLEDFDGNRVYAEYGFFRIGDSASNYQLTIISYSGDAGDSMIANYDINGMAFTTKDRDNDGRSGSNCGIYYASGWWHKNCARSNVNGLYNGQGVSNHNGMTWYDWKNRWEALQKVEMKIKCLD